MKTYTVYQNLTCPTSLLLYKMLYSPSVFGLNDDE